MEKNYAKKIISEVLTKLKLSCGLACLAAGSYYFNFFMGTSDSGEVYLSASFARSDLLIATVVLWLTTSLICWFALWFISKISTLALRRAAQALFAVLMLAMFLRCYMKLAGYAFSDQILTAAGMMDGLPYPQWLLILPILLILPFFYKKPTMVSASLSFLAVAGFVSIPIGAMRMWETPIGRAHHNDVISKVRSLSGAELAQPPAVRRVVWVVFDEFDPEIAFDPAGQIVSLLPELTRLRAESLTMTQAASPSNSTDVSLPAMLMGVPAVAGINFSGPGEAALSSVDGRSFRFITENTVFGRLPGGAGEGAILGFYHPYCQVLSVGRCDSFSANMGTRWFDGLANLVPKRLSGILDAMTEITTKQINLLPGYLADDSKALTLLHLNIPHLPAHYAKQYFGLESADAYQLNLQMVDIVVGRILRELERSSARQQQLLILSSDHWYRMNRAQTPHPTLLIIKLSNDQQHMTMETPVSTYHLANLVIEYLDGHLQSHQEIKNWYSTLPFSPSWIPDAR